jgi:hypothetical protein
MGWRLRLPGRRRRSDQHHRPPSIGGDVDAATVDLRKREGRRLAVEGGIPAEVEARQGEAGEQEETRPDGRDRRLLSGESRSAGAVNRYPRFVLSATAGGILGRPLEKGGSLCDTGLEEWRALLLRWLR